jgi:hypothetical protein
VHNLLSDGDFSGSGWTAAHAALDRDTDHSEGGDSALRIRATGGGPASIAQDVAGWRELRGGWLTAGIRVRIPDGAPASAGRVAITQVGGSDAGTTTSNALPDGRDGFMWVTVSRRIAADATGVRVTVYADTDDTAGTEVTVDRAALARGVLPRDIR